MQCINIINFINLQFDGYYVSPAENVKYINKKHYNYEI